MSNKKSWLHSRPDYFANNRLWHLVLTVVVVFIAFSMLSSYLSTANKRNMVLNQSDIMLHKGMSKDIVDFRKAHDNQEPLWTNGMFGGMPTFQVSTWYPNNLMQKLDNLLNLRGIVNPPIGNLFVLFLGLFLLLRALKVDPMSAAVASIGFMLCSYYFIVIEAGHNSKVNAVAYLPLVFAGIIHLYRGRWGTGIALTTLGMGLEINANHLQITYYGFFVIGAIALSELGRALMPDKNRPAGKQPIKQYLIASVLMVICMGVSFAPNIGRLRTNAEYVTETMRGGSVLQTDPNSPEQPTAGGLPKEYAYTWSYGIYETFTLINPFYFGDAANSRLGKDSETYEVLARSFPPQTAEQLSNIWPTYMGDQPMHGGPTYVGVVICFLFILGLVVVPARYRWWLLGATVIGIMLSWGRNLQWFSDIFYDNFPKYDHFRSVSMWLTIPSITMATMAGLALKSVFKNEGNDSEKLLAKKIGVAAGVTIVLLLMLAWVQPGVQLRSEQDPAKIASFLGRVGLADPDPAMIASLTDALTADRDAMITGPAYKGILLVLLAGGALIGFAMMRKRLKTKEMSAIAISAIGLVLIGLIAWDMVPVNKRYLNEESFVKESKFMEPYTPSPADNMIKADKDPNYRVLNLAGNMWNDAITSYHHKSIGGYSPAKLRRYQDLIENCYDTEFGYLQQAFAVRDSTQMLRIDSALQKTTVLNMMNTKYIIVNPAGGVLPNKYAMGNAWIVGGYEVLARPDDVIAKLQATNLREKMLVEEKSSEQLKGFQASLDPTATIQPTSYQLNELKYKFSSTGGKEQLVVFSEVYYNSGKGWQAYLDGQPVEHFRCDYLLRGMRVPAGNHEIVFKMEPKSYYQGETLALVASLLLFGVVIGAFAWDFMRGGKDDEQEADPVTGATVDKKV